MDRETLTSLRIIQKTTFVYEDPVKYVGIFRIWFHEWEIFEDFWKVSIIFYDVFDECHFLLEKESFKTLKKQDD